MKNKGFVSGLIIGILALGLVLSCDTDNNDNGDKTPTLENITVNYEQGGTVYPSTPLDDLKTDLTVTANYSDGSNSTVTGYTLNGTLTAGASEITVSFQGKTAKFNVIVTATGATLSYITAEYNQSGIVYPSTPLDDLKDDLIVTAHFSDNSEQEAHGYILSGELQIGESELTVTYEGNITTFNVNVTDPTVTLLNITAVYTQGGKTIFTSTPLDDLKDDLIVTAHFSDENENYNPTGYELSGTLNAGASTITVTFSGETATFNVTVTAVALLDITAVYTQGGKTIYPSTPLDDLKDDLIITAYFSDENENYNPTGYELSGTLAVGTSKITVTYSGKTATFEVNVSIEYVTITWNLRGGRWPDGFTPVTQVEKGGTLATPTAPTKNNCNFIGWYSDSALTQSYMFGAVNSNLNLYVRWQQITPQFYWGHYIPSTILQQSSLHESGNPVFNLDELVATVDNARTRRDFDHTDWGYDSVYWDEDNVIVNQDGSIEIFNLNGVPRPFIPGTLATGALRWQEFKFSENSSVIQQKAISYTGVGYYYFVSPKEYGDLYIIDALGVGVYSPLSKTGWKREEKTIDGVEYYIFYNINPLTSAPSGSGINYTMRFINQLPVLTGTVTLSTKTPETYQNVIVTYSGSASSTRLWQILTDDEVIENAAGWGMGTPITLTTFIREEYRRKQLKIRVMFTSHSGYLESELTEPVIDSGWTNIFWNLNGGSWTGTDFLDLAIITGEELWEPADPVKSGYTFIGWYTDAALTQKFSFDTVVTTANLYLYAKWQ